MEGKGREGRLRPGAQERMKSERGRGPPRRVNQITLANSTLCSERGWTGRAAVLPMAALRWAGLGWAGPWLVCRQYEMHAPPSGI